MASLATRAEAQSGGAYFLGREASQNWRSPTQRLVRRVSLGMSATEAAIARQLGYNGYLERQLNYEAIDDSGVDRVVASRWPETTWTSQQIYNSERYFECYLAMVEPTLYRAVYSRRQLYERMVEFWYDHFNVHPDKPTSLLALPYLRDAIRRHAMGNFHVLLRATAFSPAMLSYLDNDANYAFAPNINYVRELHELHTVSSTGGYTGTDLRQAALVFTGWTWEWRRNHPNSGRFYYNHDLHAPGDKVVMGLRIPAGARDEGEKLLQFLAFHPKTAEFIATKLCRWFLGYDPPASVVTAAKEAFTNSRGDIRSVLRVILAEPNVVASKPKYKRPYHFMMSALRALRTRTYRFSHLHFGFLGNAGQIPFNWDMPDGYPDRFGFWAPAVRPRIDFALSLCSGYIDGLETNFPQIHGTDPDPQKVVTQLNATIFGGEMSNADRDALFQYLDTGDLTEERLRSAVALCLASPSFQWY
jgi:uncharacterized protein (DUF1800 family)